MLRTGRKGLAAATLLGDMLKGTAAVLLAAHFVGRDAALAAGLGAFLGHLFPVWLKFKGGKGVATYIGVLLGLAWPAALIFGAIWLAVACRHPLFLARRADRQRADAVALWLMSRPDAAVLFAVLTALLWFMHRANIARLLHGSEAKIGAKAAPSG